MPIYCYLSSFVTPSLQKPQKNFRKGKLPIDHSQKKVTAMDK